jgi:hypothetical protein
MSYTIDIEMAVYLFSFFIYAVLGSQLAHSFGFLIIGTILLERYEDGISDPPVNLLDRMFNAMQRGMFGIGPRVYKKLKRFNWLIGKALFIVFFCVQWFLTFLLVEIISSIVDSLF